MGGWVGRYLLEQHFLPGTPCFHIQDYLGLGLQKAKTVAFAGQTLPQALGDVLIFLSVAWA